MLEVFFCSKYVTPDRYFFECWSKWKWLDHLGKYKIIDHLISLIQQSFFHNFCIFYTSFDLMFLKWISYFKNITFVNLSFVSLFVLLQDYLMTLWILIKYTDNSFDNAQLLVLLSNKKHIKKINGKTYCRHDVYIGLENHCWLWDTPLDGNS